MIYFLKTNERTTMFNIYLEVDSGIYLEPGVGYDQQFYNLNNIFFTHILKLGII